MKTSSVKHFYSRWESQVTFIYLVLYIIKIYVKYSLQHQKVIVNFDMFLFISHYFIRIFGLLFWLLYLDSLLCLDAGFLTSLTSKNW